MIGGFLFFLPFAVIGSFAALFCLSIAAVGLMTGKLSTAMWGMLFFSGAFACAFGGVGYWGIGSFIGDRRRTRKREAFAQSYPSEPWRWREDWAAGEIQSSRGSAAAYLVWFVATWNLIVWAVSLFRTPEMAPLPFWGTVLIFVAKAIGIIGGLCAVMEIISAWRGRSTRLRLSAMPIRRGNRFSGQLLLRQDSRITPFRLVLICQERITTQSGNTTTITDTTVFTTSSTLDEHSGMGEIWAVEIPVPADAPATDDTHAWHLDVYSWVGHGERRIATFEVPVF